ncbi:MAG: transporter permease, partial [Paenibacillus sp.]|nr:transporter permease [Paenibacillus sp.]
MNKMWTVVGFTFRNKVHAKSFLISTIIFAVIISVLINLPNIISKFSSDEATKIGVIENGTEITQMLQAYYSKQEVPEYEIVPLKSTGTKEGNEQLALDQIAEGNIEGVLELTDDPAAGFPKAAYKSKKSMSFSSTNKLQTVLQILKTEIVVKDIGLKADQLAKLNSPVKLDTVQLQQGDTGKSEAEMAMAYILVYVLLFLLYMGVIAYGNMVAMEITAEKSSRVMELLITSVSPLRQMFGKIIGICLLGLLQIGMFIAIAVANLAIPGNSEMLKDLDINLSDLDPMLLVYFVIFYLLGYFIYSTLFAAVGSLVSRTEEVGQAIMPLTFLIVAGFMIAMYGLQNPTAPFVVAMSFVPFFSPLIMFLRVGMSDPA